MHRIMTWAGVGLLFSLGLGVAGTQAQQPVAAEPQATSQTVQTPREVVPPLLVPRLMKFAGTLKDDQGKPRTGAVGVTFAIYKDQEGGAALWLETQNVQLDEQGHYSVLLGSTKSEGLPLELFSGGEPRWLGAQVNLAREVEQPRVLLVSVPYALKAVDAESLGGLPASAYALAQTSAAAVSGGPGVSGTSGTSAAGRGAAPQGTTSKAATSAKPQVAGAIATSFIPVFTDSAGTLGSSVLFQNATSNFLGLGTMSPLTPLDLRLTGSGTGGVVSVGNQNGGRFGVLGFSTGPGFPFIVQGDANDDLALGANLTEQMRITSGGNVGIGTSTPANKLAVVGGANQLALQANSASVFGGEASMLFSPAGSAHGWQMGANATGPGFFLWENGGGYRLTVQQGGNVGIGTTTPTQKLSVAGAIQSTSGGFVFPDSTVQATAVPTSALVRAITYLAGCDNCSVLTNADSQNVIFQDLIGAMTINSVTCFSDGGSPTINIQVNHGGSLSNVLSSNLSCSSSGATSTSFSTSALSVNDILNFTLVPDSVAKRVTTIIKATVN